MQKDGWKIASVFTSLILGLYVTESLAMGLEDVNNGSNPKQKENTMSQSRNKAKTRISVRHTASAFRETISRVIQKRNVNGNPEEVVNYDGRNYRVHRRGRGVFIYTNRPLGSSRRTVAA